MRTYSRALMGFVYLVIAGTISAYQVELVAQEVQQPQAGAQPTMSAAEFAASFVVKVVNRVAFVLHPSISGGHGSGFIVGFEDRVDPRTSQTRRVGVVYTNRHVVENSGSLNVQEVKLEFQTGGPVAESVEAKVVYISQVNDFAIVEFNLDDVHFTNRTTRRLSQARLPEAGSPLLSDPPPIQALQGREALAIGNPLSGANITTFGEITGLHRDPTGAFYLQTQAPINPGNSGGPLLDRESLTVIGMNSAKMTGADNTGFAIPIGVLMDEHAAWKADPSISQERGLPIRFGALPRSMLRVLRGENGASYERLIDSVVNGYFQRFLEAITVHDAHPATGLLAGDVIVTVDGVARGTIYEILRTVQRTRADTLAIKILRNGRVHDVAVPIARNRIALIREDLDFVMVSGLVFREMSSTERWLTASGESRVILEGMYASPSLSTGAFRPPPLTSILVGIDFGGSMSPIRRLSDLKRVLNENIGQAVARLHVAEPVLVQTEASSPPGFLIDPATRRPVMSARDRVSVIPISDVHTPLNLSMRQLRERISLDPARISSVDWRQYARVRTSVPRAGPRDASAGACSSYFAR